MQKKQQQQQQEYRTILHMSIFESMHLKMKQI